jgi:hypothetical protein
MGRGDSEIDACGQSVILSVVHQRLISQRSERQPGIPSSLSKTFIIFRLKHHMIDRNSRCIA